ncbi:ArsR/SmtB family transcription factor [Gordonia humi]|uniref:DNA-binding transcriptional ArsR family regulator n=1 Tax=Gordonia humi TaxID=686429 RepID=A0A840F113_9ACTN|nr:helix-turn-helix transcriptional regulator [Gordonia humi]MBB4136304.1 DNA-binding transcriptional ArsR family regulator [Gordonia humi]
MHAHPDLAAVAELFADSSRARMLMELIDGAARPAGHLATIAGVSASTASSHLARLVEAEFVTVETSGRTRRYRIVDPRVVAAIEGLLPLARTEPPTGLTAVRAWDRLRVARSCYDHLAGGLGVDVLAGLVECDALVRIDGVPGTGLGSSDELSSSVPVAPYRVGPRGAEVFGVIGVDLGALNADRRPLIRACVDWSEQRHHLAGGLGAAVMTGMIGRGWVERRTGRRDLRVIEPEAVAAWLTGGSASADASSAP